MSALLIAARLACSVFAVSRASRAFRSACSIMLSRGESCWCVCHISFKLVIEILCEIVTKAVIAE